MMVPEKVTLSKEKCFCRFAADQLKDFHRRQASRAGVAHSREHFHMLDVFSPQKRTPSS
jgi:hypothetical protein